MGTFSLVDLEICFFCGALPVVVVFNPTSMFEALKESVSKGYCLSNLGGDPWLVHWSDFNCSIGEGVIYKPP
jgi:hypothetical protein